MSNILKQYNVSLLFLFMDVTGMILALRILFRLRGSKTKAEGGKVVERIFRNSYILLGRALR